MMNRSKTKAQSKKDAIRYGAEKVKRCKDCALYFNGKCDKISMQRNREDRACVYFKQVNK